MGHSLTRITFFTGHRFHPRVMPLSEQYFVLHYQIYLGHRKFISPTSHWLKDQANDFFQKKGRLSRQLLFKSVVVHPCAQQCSCLHTFIQSGICVLADPMQRRNTACTFVLYFFLPAPIFHAVHLPFSSGKSLFSEGDVCLPPVFLM